MSAELAAARTASKRSRDGETSGATASGSGKRGRLDPCAAGAALRSFELRLGCGGAAGGSSTLTDVDGRCTQHSVAARKWAEFTAARQRFSDAIGAADFDTAAAACAKGALGLSLFLIAAANQFEAARLETDAEARRAGVRAARTRVKAAATRVPELLAALSQLTGVLDGLAAAGASAAADAAYARRLAFVRAARLFADRLAVLAELEHLAFERSSVEQTVRHVRGKRGDLAALRHGLKQLSPASDASTAEVAPLPPRALGSGTGGSHVAGGGAGEGASERTSGILASRAQAALDLAAEFDNACARLQATADAAMRVVAETPPMRAKLAAFLDFAANLPHARLRERAIAAGWAVAAIAGEFGCDVRAAAAVLSQACESMQAVLKPDKSERS